jgi:hypothetical protein
MERITVLELDVCRAGCWNGRGIQFDSMQEMEDLRVITEETFDPDEYKSKRRIKSGSRRHPTRCPLDDYSKSERSSVLPSYSSASGTDDSCLFGLPLHLVPLKIVRSTGIRSSREQSRQQIKVSKS